MHGKEGENCPTKKVLRKKKSGEERGICPNTRGGLLVKGGKEGGERTAARRGKKVCRKAGEIGTPDREGNI